MDSSYDRNKKAEGIYQDDIYFGSLSENKLYNILLKYKDNYNLNVHKPLILNDSINYKWKVDFTLSAINYTDMDKFRKLLYICNEDIIEGYISEIYIEYKGWNDENFKKHMNYLISHNSDILRRLIIISDKPSAYILENIHEKCRYKKLITSLKAINYWLNDVYC